jgi:replicative DNA helicase
MSQINKLSDYGYNYQIKTITSLLTDEFYLNQINDIIKPEYFDNNGLEHIVKKILEYYQLYKKKPTADSMKVFLEQITNNDLLKTNVRKGLKDVYDDSNLGSNDLTFIKNETLKFCKNQVVKQALLDSVDLLELGNYDEINSVMTRAFQAGIDKDVGHQYKNHFEERYAENPRFPISTPWSVINKIMDGGLGRGELGIIVGGPGGGKSRSLINIAGNAMKQGKNVIYYTLELYSGYVAKVFDTYFTGIYPNKLIELKNEIQLKINTIPGNLIIKFYPTGNASINTLAAHYEKVKSFHFNPDLICIDYLDLLKSNEGGYNKNKRDDQVLGDIYKQARGFAGEYDIPVWSVSQSNRESQDSEFIQGGKISGSFEKLMIADFVASQQRTVKDKVNNVAKWHIIKNRFGPDGQTYPAKTDLGLCRINIYEENSEEGQEIETKRNSEENTNQQGNKKDSKEFKTFMNTNNKVKSKF